MEKRGPKPEGCGAPWRVTGKPAEESGVTLSVVSLQQRGQMVSGKEEWSKEPNRASRKA